MSHPGFHKRKILILVLWFSMLLITINCYDTIQSEKYYENETAAGDVCIFNIRGLFGIDMEPFDQNRLQLYYFFINIGLKTNKNLAAESNCTLIPDSFNFISSFLNESLAVQAVHWYMLNCVKMMVTFF